MEWSRKDLDFGAWYGSCLIVWRDSPVSGEIMQLIAADGFKTMKIPAENSAEGVTP
jgi:hypothetical protein